LALGLLESNFALGDFPRIQRGESLVIARKEVGEGRPAYLKAKKGGKDLMVYLNPERNGVVTARVVPGLHYVTSHGLGRYVGTSDRLQSFASILRNGFESPTPEDNVVLLTLNHKEEKWRAGYPVERNVYRSYMRKDNVQDRGEVMGDSLRVVLWSGFVGFNNSIVSVRGVGGVVVTAPGSDWRRRVEFYTRLYEDKQLLAPIELYDVHGRHERIGYW